PFRRARTPLALHSFPTRRSSDLAGRAAARRQRRSALAGRLSACGPWSSVYYDVFRCVTNTPCWRDRARRAPAKPLRGRAASDERSEEHTSELQSRSDLVCRLLLE